MSVSQEIIKLCKHPNTALQAIHLAIAHHGASRQAFLTMYERVMADNDVDGAYYLASLAQNIDDLPFDGKPLIEMVMNGDDKQMKLSLIDKMPKHIQPDYLDKL